MDRTSVRKRDYVLTSSKTVVCRPTLPAQHRSPSEAQPLTLVGQWTADAKRRSVNV